MWPSWDHMFLKCDLSRETNQDARSKSSFATKPRGFDRSLHRLLATVYLHVCVSHARPQKAAHSFVLAQCQMPVRMPIDIHGHCAFLNLYK